MGRQNARGKVVERGEQTSLKVHHCKEVSMPGNSAGGKEGTKGLPLTVCGLVEDSVNYVIIEREFRFYRGDCWACKMPETVEVIVGTEDNF